MMRDMMMRTLRAAGLCAGLLLGLGGFLAGCNEGKEGDRCNPNLPPDDDECNSGLTCQSSPTCPESFCCPTPLTSSLNPFCNGSACPPPADGGSS